MIKGLKLTNKKREPIKNSDGQDMVFDIQPVAPEWKMAYPPKVKTLPIGSGNHLQKWQAEIKIGYNQTDGEVNLYNDPDKKRILNSKHPYHNKSKSVEFNLHGINLCSKTFGRILGIDEVSADRYMRNEYPRVQCNLLYGFSSTFTKNDIEESDNFKELLKDIKEVLEKEGILDDKYKPRANDEFIATEQLKSILEETDHTVKLEYSVSGLRVDMLVSKDGEVAIWENKINEADGPDIVQLLGYLALNKDNIKKGIICAYGLKPNAQNIIKQINDDGIYHIGFKSMGKLIGS